MSGDELIVLIAAVVLGAWRWAPWAQLCLSPANFGRHRPLRQLGLAAPALACAGVLFVLLRFSSHDVRDSALYLLFYTAIGAAWLGAIAPLAGLLGLSLRDDWLERHNSAAAITGTGLLLGAAAAFAGGNIGDGPGWWVVIFCSVLSTAALGVAWWLYAKLSGTMDRIVIERETGAAWRLAGFLAAVGVMAGRSVAGNWHDTVATVHDFAALAAPILPYAVLAGAIESRLGSNARTASGATRFGALAAHAVSAAAFLFWAGPWN